jgi:hypothetical protein
LVDDGCSGSKDYHYSLEDEFVSGVAVISCSDFFVMSKPMHGILFILSEWKSVRACDELVKGTVIANNYQLDE